MRAREKDSRERDIKRREEKKERGERVIRSVGLVEGAESNDPVLKHIPAAL